MAGPGRYVALRARRRARRGRARRTVGLLGGVARRLEADLRERIAGADPIDPGVSMPADAWADDVLALLPLERRGSKLYFPGRSRRSRARSESAALERELARAGVHATKVSDEEVARFLEHGALVRLGNGYAIGVDSFAWQGRSARGMSSRRGDPLARFRDLLGTGRRDAQLLLERFDADGLTRRVGDVRCCDESPGCTLRVCAWRA